MLMLLEPAVHLLPLPTLLLRFPRNLLLLLLQPFLDHLEIDHILLDFSFDLLEPPIRSPLLFFQMRGLGTDAVALDFELFLGEGNGSVDVAGEEVEFGCEVVAA